MSETNRGFTAVLRNRNFLFVWMAQAVSQTAQNGINFVQIILIEQLTGSSGPIALMILAFSLPAVLFSVLAGTVIDRLSRKLVMVVSNGLRVLTSLAYLAAVHTLGEWPLLIALYVVTFIASSIGQFFAPAEVATIPALVGREGLLPANSLFNLTLTASQIVGLVLLFPLLVKIGNAWRPEGEMDLSFGVVAAMYFAATLLVGLIPRDQPPSYSSGPASAIGRAWHELRVGWRFVRTQRPIYLALAHLTLVNTMVMIMVMLAPGFAARVLRVGAEDAVYIFGPAGGGMLLGTLLIGRFGHLVRRERLSNLGLLTMGLVLASLGVVGWLSTGERMVRLLPADWMLIPMVMVLSFIMGLDFAATAVPAQTALQEHSPARVRGRVFAVQFMLANLVAIPPMLFIGQLADYIGIPRVTFGVALGVFAVALWSLWQARHVMPVPTETEVDELVEA